MKTYTDADLALFARYETHRADLRPAACNPEGPCWVREGPPALVKGTSGVTTCAGCKASIPGLLSRITPGDKADGAPQARPMIERIIAAIGGFLLGPAIAFAVVFACSVRW